MEEVGLRYGGKFSSIALVMRNALRVSEDSTQSLPIQHQISYVEILSACKAAQMQFNEEMNFDKSLTRNRYFSFFGIFTCYLYTPDVPVFYPLKFLLKKRRFVKKRH